MEGLGLEVLVARRWGLGGTEEGEGWSWESGEGVLAVGGLAGRLGGGRSPPRGGGGAWRGRDWKRVHTTYALLGSTTTVVRAPSTTYTM